MLKTIFENLDQWITEQNVEATSEGLKSISVATFQVVWQTALLEAKLSIEIAATVDVDAFNDAEAAVVAKLNELLLKVGLEYDQLSREIWMPAETVYVDLYRGSWTVAQLAKPEFVMLSKAKMALRKNKLLLREYLASEPSETFFEPCQVYNVDLMQIVED